MKTIARLVAALALAVGLVRSASAQGVDRRYAYYHGWPSARMYYHYGYAMLPDGTTFVPNAATPMYYGPALASPYYDAGNYSSPYYRPYPVQQWYPHQDANGQMRWRR